MTLPRHLQGAVLLLRAKGWSSVRISQHLRSRYCYTISDRAIRKHFKKDAVTVKTRRRKLEEIHLQYINFALNRNRNITASELQAKLLEVFGVRICLSSIKYYRQKLGWTASQAGYCQMINSKNKKFRKKWALYMLSEKEDFKDVIFSDETTVEMSSSGNLTFYHKGASIDKQPGKAPKGKHSYKLHVWGGISYRGRTSICIFSGIMDSDTYQQILEENLLPFAEERFPDGYLLYQDNDSKHKSKSTTEWLQSKGIQTISTPASSPDINPIENVWAAMKDYLRRKEKPRTKEALKVGIVNYWKTLTPDICGTFIDHIHKVLPEVVLNDGGATMY